MRNLACGSSCQGHGDVAGAGRQVHEQVVELAPVHVLEELLQRLVEHRPTPYDGRVLVEEEADRHDLHPFGGDVGKDLALARDLGLGGADAEHARLRVAPHVGVEHAHGLALGPQRGGEVGGQGRLAHAALARADADDVRDLRERALGQAAAAELLLQRALLLVAEHVEVDIDAGHALEGADRLCHGGLEMAADRAARRGQRHGDVDDPGGVMDRDRADHVELDDGAPELRVDDRLQGLGDLLSRRHEHRDSRSSDPPCLKTVGAAETAPTIEGGEVLLLPAKYGAGRAARRDASRRRAGRSGARRRLARRPSGPRSRRSGRRSRPGPKRGRPATAAA